MSVSGSVSNDLMGDLMGHACGFIETNRILAWLLGCLAAWLLGCLAAVGGQSYLPIRPKLMAKGPANKPRLTERSPGFFIRVE
jgi:hypothetical protein